MELNRGCNWLTPTGEWIGVNRNSLLEFGLSLNEWCISFYSPKEFGRGNVFDAVEWLVFRLSVCHEYSSFLVVQPRVKTTMRVNMKRKTSMKIHQKHWNSEPFWHPIISSLFFSSSLPLNAFFFVCRLTDEGRMLHLFFTAFISWLLFVLNSCRQVVCSSSIDYLAGYNNAFNTTCFFFSTAYISYRKERERERERESEDISIIVTHLYFQFLDKQNMEKRLQRAIIIHWWHSWKWLWEPNASVLSLNMILTSLITVKREARTLPSAAVKDNRQTDQMLH